MINSIKQVSFNYYYPVFLGIVALMLTGSWCYEYYINTSMYLNYDRYVFGNCLMLAILVPIYYALINISSTQYCKLAPSCSSDYFSYSKENRTGLVWRELIKIVYLPVYLFWLFESTRFLLWIWNEDQLSIFIGVIFTVLYGILQFLYLILPAKNTLYMIKKYRKKYDLN